MFACLSQKNGFVFVNIFSHFEKLNHYFQPYKIGFGLLTRFKTILQKTQITGEGFGRVSTFVSLSQKNGFVFVNQFSHFKALSHYFQPYKIRFRLLTGFKTNLQETQIQREGFGRVSTFPSLSQKHSFVFVIQFLPFKALNQYFQLCKIRFRVFTSFKTLLQKTQRQGEGFRRVSTFVSLSQKNGFVLVNEFSHFKALSHYFQPYKIRFRLLTGFKTILYETQIKGEGFGRVSTFASLSQKNGFVFVNQIWHFKALNYYFQPYKIRFRLLTGFKTILQETQIQGERFGRVSTFASLSQKNGFVLVNQFSHFKALSHYFQHYKVGFSLLTGFKTILQETEKQGERFGRVSTFVSLCHKSGFVFVKQFLHFKALSHYFQLYKIAYRLLTGFKTVLQETQIQGEGFGRVSLFTSLSQKNDLYSSTNFCSLKF